MTDRQEVRRVLLNYVYMENPEGESLTSMTVCAGRTVTSMTVRRRTLEKKIETLKRGVSNRHDGHAERTVMTTTVRHMCPLEDTWVKNETLRRGVSDRHDGHA